MKDSNPYRADTPAPPAATAQPDTGRVSTAGKTSLVLGCVFLPLTAVLVLSIPLFRDIRHVGPITLVFPGLGLFVCSVCSLVGFFLGVNGFRRSPRHAKAASWGMGLNAVVAVVAITSFLYCILAIEGAFF